MSNALTSERCYGVDVLKVLSMFLVVVLHILEQGGVLAGFEDQNALYWTATLLQIVAYCCVNCFALATGFLMVGRKARYRKLLPMWLTVAFYCGIGLLLKKYVLHDPIYLTTLLQAVFPVSASVYWYFTAYFCLYLFMPFLNQLVEVMSRQQHRNLLVMGFFLFCVPQVANVTRLHATDIVGLNDGYGMFWLMYLYFLGAGMKKHGFFLGMRSGKAVLGFVSMAVLTCLSKYGYEMLPEQLPGIVVSIVREYGSSRFISYLSPTIVAEAVFLSVACINWKVPGWMRKPLVWLSPLVFQVYIIHTHPIVFDYLGGKMAFLGTLPLAKMVAGVLGIGAGIFLGCIAIDWVRFQLFRLLQVNRWTDDFAQWTGEKVRLLLNKKEKTTV